LADVPALRYLRRSILESIVTPYGDVAQMDRAVAS